MKEVNLINRIKQPEKPLIVAHRGASFSLPENTLESFEKAIQEKFDYLETDLHLTSDGEIILIHDFSLDRTTNSKELFGKPKIKTNELTLLQIKYLSIAGGKGYKESYRGKFKVPTLKELLAKTSGKIGLVLEVKPDLQEGGIIIDKTVKYLKEFKSPQDRVYIASFHRKNLKKALGTAPHIKRMLNITKTLITPDEAINAKADALSIDCKLIDSFETVEKFQRNGLKVFVWPVDDKDRFAKYLGLRVDGMMCNQKFH